MTYHTTRSKPAAGSTGNNPLGQKLSPRIAFSLPEDDMRRLTWWSAKKGKPVSAILRDAVWAYLLPIAADADKEAKDEGQSA